jgi:hypothetical protein
MKVPVTKTRKPSRNAFWELREPGWRERVRNRLEALIKKGAGQGLPVVFDFDNTIVCGDIGEATLAVLARSGLIPLERLPSSFFPPFRPSSGPLVTIETSADLAEYYEAYLAPTAHGSKDTTPLANGYALAVEVLEGLNPYQVVEATRTAYGLGRSGEVRLIAKAMSSMNGASNNSPPVEPTRSKIRFQTGKLLRVIGSSGKIGNRELRPRALDAFNGNVAVLQWCLFGPEFRARYAFR